MRARQRRKLEQCGEIGHGKPRSIYVRTPTSCRVHGFRVLDVIAHGVVVAFSNQEGGGCYSFLIFCLLDGLQELKNNIHRVRTRCTTRPCIT